MLVLVIMDTIVVLLLTVLVAGLLRSHADILRALHSLRAGVGDPSTVPDDGERVSSGSTTAFDAGIPLHLGPPLPGERSSRSAHDVEGVDANGDAVAVSVTHNDHFTLLAFLSSGCATCAGFWEFLGDRNVRLPADLRVVAVTKGPDLESPAEVRRRASATTSVVMSSRAWDDYEVPGSPFFVLIDGRTHQRVGEGVARHFAQVAELVSRARAEAELAASPTRRGVTSGLGGIARESLNDQELISAGIHPGHPSLYPSRLEDVFPGTPERAEGLGPAR